MALPHTTDDNITTSGAIGRKHRGFIHRYHDSIFAGHLGVSRTVYRLLDRAYWPGLREDVRGQLFSMLGAEVSVSSPCAYGTCFHW